MGNSIAILRSGNRESVSGLIGSFNGDQLTSKEFLDFVVSKGELKEEFAAAISQRIVMEARCGSAWVGCLLGLSDFGEFASGTYQNAIFILLRQANIANGEYNRTVLPQDEQRRTEEARELALQGTERVRGEEQRRTTQAREEAQRQTGEVLGNVRLRVETAIEREHRATIGVQERADHTREMDHQTTIDTQLKADQTMEGERRETARQRQADRNTQIVTGVGIGFGAGLFTGGGLGALIGSVVPVVGTAVGAAIGAAIGGGVVGATGAGIAAAVHQRPE